MSTFNSAATLSEAVQSILDQEYTDWELVVCDDGSTDNTFELLTQLAVTEPDRIVLLRNAFNQKLPYSLNRCLSASSGELIARMDSDDISDPMRLQRQVAFLDTHPDVDLVGTAMRRFNSRGLADIRFPPTAPDRYTLRKAMPFYHATILARRQVYDSLGGYTVSTRTERGQDYDLWFRFYHRGFRGSNLQEPLYLVREDNEAIRRRTPSVRLNGYRTTLFGYRLLKYPLHWYVRPTLSLMKILVPYSVVDLLREHQAVRSRNVLSFDRRK